jgi:transposase
MRHVEDNDEIIERIAAIDFGKSELVASVRVPDPGRAGRASRNSSTAPR